MLIVAINITFVFIHFTAEFIEINLQMSQNVIQAVGWWKMVAKRNSLIKSIFAQYFPYPKTSWLAKPCLVFIIYSFILALELLAMKCPTGNWCFGMISSRILLTFFFLSKILSLKCIQLFGNITQAGWCGLGHSMIYCNV